MRFIVGAIFLVGGLIILSPLIGWGILLICVMLGIGG